MLDFDEKNKWSVKAPLEITYDVVQTTNLFSPSNKLLLTGGKDNTRRFIILDKKLYPRYHQLIRDYFTSHNIEHEIMPFKTKEHNKSIKSLLKIYKRLDRFHLKRRSEPVIIIGGGVTLDVAAFAADSYRRGVPYIKVPTTLMGYIDGALGVKTAVNFNGHKNRVGSFSAPIINILDRSFFGSLPKRHILNGVGEIIKIAVIKDKELFELLEKRIHNCIDDKFLTTGDMILSKSIHDMLEELAPNLREHNLERIVDFGHTFGPSLEMLNIKHLLHGEAVAIDIALSSAIACIKSILSENNFKRILNLIKSVGLPIKHKKLTRKLAWQGLTERTVHRDGLQRVPVPKEIGVATFLNNITLQDIDAAMNLLKTF